MLTADEQAPQGRADDIATERMEEFTPDLDSDLLQLLQATAEMERADVLVDYGPLTDKV